MKARADKRTRVRRFEALREYIRRGQQLTSSQMVEWARLQDAQREDGVRFMIRVRAFVTGIVIGIGAAFAFGFAFVIYHFVYKFW